MSQKVITKTSTNTYESVESTTCELCGRTTTAEDWDAPEWYENGNTHKVIIKYEYGWGSQDGGSMKVIEYDLCPNCFKEHLMAWMAELGATPRTEKKEW